LAKSKESVLGKLNLVIFESFQKKVILILLSLVNKSMGYLEGKLVGITKFGLKRNLYEILVYNTFFSMMALTLFLPWSNNSDIVVDVNLAAGHQSSRFQ